MAGSRRQRGQFARDPLTYSTGTTPGEQTISAATTAPSLVTHGFVIAPLDTAVGNSQLAAPALMDVLVELSDGGGGESDAAVENFSMWFYFPAAATTNKWRESGPLTASGPDVRGAKGADASADPRGNTYKMDVPQGATRGFVHFQSLTTNVVAHVLVYPDN